MMHALLLVGLLMGDPSPSPQLIRDADGSVRVALPRALFETSEVDRQLGSGLTTSLLLTIDLRGESGKRGEGAARVDIRYEPWDEAYHVRCHPFGGVPDAEARILSKEALAGLLCAPELVITRLAPGRWQGRLVLEVLPYSDVEQAGARAWFTRALAGSDGGGAPSMFDRLYVASIKRRARERHEWEVVLTP